MRIFLLIAFVVLLLCLGVVVYIGIDLHKDTVKMRRNCKRCALSGMSNIGLCPWADCFFDENHPYFKKMPRGSKNAKH